MAARGGGILADDIGVEQAVVVGDELVGHVDNFFVDGARLGTHGGRGKEQDEDGI